MQRFIFVNLNNFFDEWNYDANDTFILNNTKNGLRIGFKERPGHINVSKILHNSKEINIINWEIQTLLNNVTKKGLTFCLQHLDGSFRENLNLNVLNQFVNYKHFNDKIPLRHVQTHQKRCVDG